MCGLKSVVIMQTEKKAHSVSRKKTTKVASPKSTLTPIHSNQNKSDQVTNGCQYVIRTKCPNVFITFSSSLSVSDDDLFHFPFVLWLNKNEGANFRKDFKYEGRFMRRISVWSDTPMKNISFSPCGIQSIKTVSEKT